MTKRGVKSKEKNAVPRSQYPWNRAATFTGDYTSNAEAILSTWARVSKWFPESMSAKQPTTRPALAGR